MKHAKKIAALLLAVCLAVSALCVSASAVAGNQYAVNIYTAEPSFRLPEGSAGIYTVLCSDSFTFDLPPAFTAGVPGFAFGGWKAQNDDMIYQPGDVIKVTKDLTFYGQWRATYPFTDLDENAGYFFDVLDAYERGLMTGTSGTAFSPDATLTRAMLWTILARMNGVEINGSSWHEQAQAWAVEAGVSDGTFPDRAVTRQELASMLYNQAGRPDNYTDTLSNFNAFPGSDQVAGWARVAMWWALNTKVLPFGDSTGTVNATSAATRAEVASAVVRFSKLTAGTA